MDLDLTKHEEKIMGEIYAPDYLRKHNDKQLHPIADMIENHLTKRIELEAKLAKAVEALKDANALCRAAFSVAEREGLSTNWGAFKDNLKISLDEQHKTLAEMEGEK